MRYLSVLVLLCGVLGLSSVLPAGEFNEKLNIGDAAPDWKDLPGADGAKHSLADYKAKQLMVVVFTCNTCPVAADYEERIAELTKKYADQMAVVAINVGSGKAEEIDAMRERVSSKSLPYTYVRDDSQEIGKAYGAGGTPEFFLLSADRKIVYMGAMDDNSKSAEVKVHYLQDAIDQVLAGKTPPKTETYAHGCRIRYRRSR